MSRPHQRLPAGLCAQPGIGASLPSSPSPSPIRAGAVCLCRALATTPWKQGQGKRSWNTGRSRLSSYAQDAQEWGGGGPFGLRPGEGGIRNLNVSPSCSGNVGFALCWDQSHRHPLGLLRPGGLICGQKRDLWALFCLKWTERAERSTSYSGCCPLARYPLGLMDML